MTESTSPAGLERQRRAPVPATGIQCPRRGAAQGAHRALRQRRGHRPGGTGGRQRIKFRRRDDAAAQRLGLDHYHLHDATAMMKRSRLHGARSRAAGGGADPGISGILPLVFAEEFSDGRITQYNHNALLWRDLTVDGVKTGQSRSAGFCLIASAHRDGMTSHRRGARRPG